MPYATGSAGLAITVRGSSRRIMIMRFRPANIRLINRRPNLPGLLLALYSRKDKNGNQNNPTDRAPLTWSLHIRALALIDRFRSICVFGKLPRNRLLGHVIDNQLIRYRLLNERQISSAVSTGLREHELVVGMLVVRSGVDTAICRVSPLAPVDVWGRIAPQRADTVDEGTREGEVLHGCPGRRFSCEARNLSAG